MRSISSKALYAFLVASLLLALLGVRTAYAASIVVNSNLDSQANDGNCTLREAIINANNDNQSGSIDCAAGAGADTISFTANFIITLVGSQLPTVTSAITINGNGPTNTIIQANAAPNTATYRVFENNGGNLTLNNLTIRNGRCNGTCPDANNDGGGIFNNGGGTLTLTNSTVSGNSAINGIGGGIFSIGGTVTITDSTLSNNLATANLAVPGTGNGGGIFNINGALSVTASTFSNNNANSGGGIYSPFGTNTIENSTFSGNGATVGGSAITAGTTACGGGNFLIDFTTIAAGTGGSAAVQVEPIICVPATITMSNTIVSRNSETQAFDIGGGSSFVDGGNNITNHATGTPAGVTVYASLGLGPLSNNGGPTQTHALLAGSPAINTAAAASCPATDQRGVTRPQGTACDIGAFELVNPPIPTPTPTPLPIPVTGSSLPASGFAPNRITSLSAQPAHLAYADLGSIWLEIPALKLKTSIVGVPQSNHTWDVRWLGQQAGWLHGTAFPTWEGNSVITAHVYDANGSPAPFLNLKTLKYGDQIMVHLSGQKYIFEVRSTRVVSPRSTQYALEHLEDYSYLTLITCQYYDEKTDTYSYRRVVRAVLVKVQTE